MELEVSQKVRAAIKAKLLELGVHVDEELPDYIMVLIANRRSPPQMESDLNLFLGDQTHRFSTWLTHVLKKLEQVTAAAASVEPPQQMIKKRKSSETEKVQVTEFTKKKKQEQEVEKKSPPSDVRQQEPQNPTMSKKQKHEERKKEERRQPPREDRRSRSPMQVRTYTPRSSAFNRLLNKRRQKSPSRSPSPPPTRPRVLSSVVVKKKIESIIKSNDPPVRKIASAVVKVDGGSKSRGVVEKPSKLLLKAVTEANADVFRSQNQSDVERKVEKKLEGTSAVIDARRSVHERLGKRVVRKSILERLGERRFVENIIVRVDGGSAVPSDNEQDNEDESVFETQQHSSTTSPGNSPRLSTTAPDSPPLQQQRLSIQVNDDDTSDESDTNEEKTTNIEQPIYEDEDCDELILQSPGVIDSKIDDDDEDDSDTEQLEEETSTPPDLREKLVKRHNARKNELAETALLPTKPPTVVINPTIKKSAIVPPVVPHQKPPTNQCKYWPNCTFKDSCVYTHPNCKFNPCTNSKCNYKHVVTKNEQTCMFFPKCHNLECKFYHPTPCRFGLGCKDKACRFYHAGSSGMGKFLAGGLPTRSLLKWENKNK